MARIDGAKLSWTLEGWRPYSWQLGRESGGLRPEIGPVPARVPGSVQEALLQAGLISDWREGLNFLACEWVEHRHWIFETILPAGAAAPGDSVALAAEGLDYSGWVLVDGKEAARFEGALTPHRIPLGAGMADGQPHRIALVFEEPPREQGQIGYTSRSRYYKPRYPYSWDWCPRIVPIGPWDRIALLTGADACVDVRQARAALAADCRTGTVEATVAIYKEGLSGKHVFSAVLRDKNCVVASSSLPVTRPVCRLELKNLKVKPWQPNGRGEAKCYTLELRLVNARGEAVWTDSRRVGFKHVTWQACEGAPKNAEPWICVVNGEPVFLQGANWVPPRDCYHDATPEEYERLIELYRAMGCNVLRVWGGGILEKPVFYDACDRAGIMVWQEFPLSSSGVENYPPEDPESIQTLKGIAESYVRRRSGHVSLLLWCGGNELTERDPGATPIGYKHPCIAMLRRVVAREDPGRRFIPTSPTGPRFAANAADYGKGLHHDIHGPWGWGPDGPGGFADLAAWRAYWEADDALFRSEVGMPGAASARQFKRFAGAAAWPPDNSYWQHTAAWWTQWDRFQKRLEGLDAAAGLKEYIRLTQKQQAQAYASAAAACKRRFPRCGGFIIWMGHDCFPCPANNSVIDFLRIPKPAYAALQKVFLGEAGQPKTAAQRSSNRRGAPSKGRKQ